MPVGHWHCKTSRRFIGSYRSQPAPRAVTTAVVSRLLIITRIKLCGHHHWLLDHAPSHLLVNVCGHVSWSRVGTRVKTNLDLTLFDSSHQLYIWAKCCMLANQPAQVSLFLVTSRSCGGHSSCTRSMKFLYMRVNLSVTHLAKFHGLGWYWAWFMAAQTFAINFTL